MQQPLFKKNIPIDEKRMDKVERIVTRLARRSKDTSKAIITPYPISYCAAGEDIKGDVLRYLFCAKGQIIKGMVVLGSKPKEGATINISIANDLGKTDKSYIISRKNILLEPNLTVFLGDRLTVSIYPNDNEVDKITEVWFAFLWVPHISEAEIKKCLIDELEYDLPEARDE